MTDSCKRKLLFVDDDADITTTMKKGLESFGFEIDAFNDPEEALLQYKPNHYDAIILDVSMAGMSGFELAKEIWAKEERAKICFLSAFEIYEDEARRVFRNFKTHCFIKKPIAISTLVEQLESRLLPAKQPATRPDRV